MSQSVDVNVVANVYPPLRESLESVRAEMAALDPNDLLQISVDPIAAVSIARGAMPRILEYRAALEKLAGFAPAILTKLPVYASAALQANSIYLSASGPPAHFQELVAEATTLRERLLSDVTALANRGLISGDRLDELKGAVGYRNVASDLLTLVATLRTNWSKVVSRTAATQEELARAELVGNQLVGDIGVRDQSPAAVATYALERQQTYTLFVNAYDEVRRAITYLRWKEDDADRIAPSLFGGKRRKASSNAETVAEPSDTVAPAAVAPAPSAAAMPTGSEAVNKAAAGFPGADPFSS